MKALVLQPFYLGILQRHYGRVIETQDKNDELSSVSSGFEAGRSQQIDKPMDSLLTHRGIVILAFGNTPEFQDH